MKKYNSFFIRKNTKELIDKLKKYGFRHNTLDDLKCDFLIYNYGMYMSINLLYSDVYDYDCKENEDLFIALCLYDRKGYGQWYVMDVEVYDDIPKGTWFQNTDRSNKRHVGTQIDPLYCHPASFEEIIEHFNKK